MNTLLNLLIAQGILGGFDVLWHHEHCFRLPQQPQAALEQKIHGLRELLYAVIFIGLAWKTWLGLWAIVLMAVLSIEVLLTAWDFVVEDQTRRLGASERITHLLLSMLGGVYLAYLIPVLVDWAQQPTQLATVDYGLRSWILTGLGGGVLFWAVRDFKSGLALSQLQR